MKKCSTCKIEKDLESFNKCKTNKDGLHYVCKDCRKKERIQNKEHTSKKQKEYYESNKEELLIKNKQYRVDKKEEIDLQRKKYRELNKEHIKMKNKEYLPIKKKKIQEKRKSNKDFQIKEVLRSKIHKLLKGLKTSYLKKLNCDFDTFKKWIEFQFEKDMNWENFGKVWELDHIIPICKFNAIIEEDTNICFNWTNLQPLYKKENRTKYYYLHLHYYFNSIISLHRFNIMQKTETNCYQRINESLSWLRKNSGMVKVQSNEERSSDFSEMGNQQPSP